MTSSPLAIELEDLHVRIAGTDIVNGVSLQVPARACVGIVGESGSGKSMTAKALAGLLPSTAEVTGDYHLLGKSVDVAGSAQQWRAIRGSHVVWLPQDPFTSLDPLRRCGHQIVASAPNRQKWNAQETDRQVRDRLREVGLDESVARAYPHQLSGGMRQRVAIAAALVTDPQVLIADEPTTALDVTTQAEILNLLEDLRSQRGMSLILITHDLALARQRADHLVVFHAGTVIESGPTEQVWQSPTHPQTQELIAAWSQAPDADDATQLGSVVLRADHISKTYPGAQRPALVDASLEVRAGQVVGVVGESGSGKTTLARCLLGLEIPDQGEFSYRDAQSQPRPWAPDKAQLVFQNPYASLNPSKTVYATLAEALRSAGRPAESVPELLELVGLDPALADRKPARLSGGERQRVAIARALAPQPRVLFCDEAVSALDAPVQAHILRTLDHLRAKLGLGIVFITHDLALVSRIAHHLLVLRDGHVVESGSTTRVITDPQHPYTRKLLDSIPGSFTAPINHRSAHLVESGSHEEARHG